MIQLLCLVSSYRLSNVVYAKHSERVGQGSDEAGVFPRNSSLVFKGKEKLLACLTDREEAWSGKCGESMFLISLNLLLSFYYELQKLHHWLLLPL